MLFACYKCNNEFETIGEIFDHMKKNHKLQNNVEKLKCVIKNSSCGKSFMNYDSLRNHLKKCDETIDQQIEVSTNISYKFSHIR